MALGFLSNLPEAKILATRLLERPSSCQHGDEPVQPLSFVSDFSLILEISEIKVFGYHAVSLFVLLV